jgi:hypothetical protein
MAIRFELGEEADGVVAFGYSPLYEAVLSLHVLAEPKHHALQHRWVRAMRALPASLRREIAALAFLYAGRSRTASSPPRHPATTTSPSTSCGRSTTTAAVRVPRGAASCRRRTYVRQLSGTRQTSGLPHDVPLR